MNVLQSSFKDFEVLAFPCNQFGKQEPAGNSTELFNGVKYVRPGGGFEPNFQMFKRLEVNGENEHPLFAFLKEHCPATRQSFASKEHLWYHPQKISDIRWNWEKFLITRAGKPFMRYDPGTKPDEIMADVQFLLEQEAPPTEAPAPAPVADA